MKLGLPLGLWPPVGGDYEYPEVAMPTVMSFLYHSIWVDFVFSFSLKPALLASAWEPDGSCSLCPI